MIRVDTIENSVIRRSIDIRKTMYTENIDCNYDGIAAIFRVSAFPEVYTPHGIPYVFRASAFPKVYTPHGIPNTFRNATTRVLVPGR